MRRLATTAMEPGKMMTYVEEDIVHIATAKELLCDGIAMDVKIVTGRSPQMTQPSKMKLSYECSHYGADGPRNFLVGLRFQNQVGLIIVFWKWYIDASVRFK